MIILRSLGQALNQYHLVSLEEKEIWTQTQRRKTLEDRTRRHLSISQEERPGTDLSLITLEGANLSNTLILDFWPVKNVCFYCLCHSVVLYYGSPSKEYTV